MRLIQRAVWVTAVFAVSFLACAVYHGLFPIASNALAADAGAAAGEVRATRFVLVDEKGAVRAVLGKFNWIDAAGDDRTKGSDPVTGLAIYSPQGRPQCQLGEVKDFVWLELKGQDGRAVLAASGDEAGMGFWCPEPVLRFGLGNQKTGIAGLVMNDVNGKSRLAAGMPPHAGFSIHLKDEKGQDVWGAPERDAVGI